jgi:hypothetical protein
MHITPVYIKIEQYKYFFSNSHDYNKTNKIWKKVYVKDFLSIIDKDLLSGVFKAYGLPEINPNRYIHVSKFQNIPIIDIILTLVLFKLIFLINQ